MTAYLQPGDKIHIAFPITFVTGMIQEDIDLSVAQAHQEITDMYALMDVKVVATSSSITLTHPVVVSVVREPRAPAPALPKRYRWSGEPQGHEHLPPWQENPETTVPPRPRHDTPPQYLDPQ